MTDLVHRYVPRGAAQAVMAMKDPEILLSGPAGTGKSRAALEKVHLLALMNPGSRGLIVRKTRESLGSTALETYRKHVAPEAIQSGVVHFYGGSAEEPPQYRYANGSALFIGGMDKSTKIMSSEYDYAFVQESTELTVDDWEAITTRLRNGKVSFQQLLADANPSVPHHWLKVRCNQSQTRLLESRHEDNPILFDDDGQITERGREYMTKLDALTGVRYQRLRLGLWVASEGLVFESFDPAVHVVDRFVPPAEWTVRWMSVDFGYTNPFVAQWWAQDPDGRLWMYREIYHTKRLVEDHAKAILAQVTDRNGRWTEPKPRAVICDHDAEDRATLERHLGMSTSPAHKTVLDGIQAVQSRLKQAGDGKPRLFIMRGALVERDLDLADAKKPTCTEEEILGYVWDKAADGKPVKENPLKLDDHGCDALRYTVAELDLAARPRIRML